MRGARLRRGVLLALHDEVPLLPELAVELEGRGLGHRSGRACAHLPRARRQARMRELEPRFAYAVPSLPFVWNSSGYERAETLDEYSDLLDIALFDLRYASDETAMRASGAPGYVASARAALARAYDKLGPLDSDEPGAAKRGVICRILVLPGHADEAVENLAWIASNLSADIHVSVMSQYAPAYMALETPPFDRCVTQEEYDCVTEAAADFGFERGWIQGFASRDASSDLVGENMSAGEGRVG